MKANKKTIAIAVAIAVAIVLPFMLFGGDTHPADAADAADAAGLASHLLPPVDCWWDVFCLGFCSC